MNFIITEYLENCSKEQLLFLIEDLHRVMMLIGEVCVDESKLHISSDKAVRRIRKHLLACDYNFYNAKIASEINMRMGKITPEQYRAILLGYGDENDE